MKLTDLVVEKMLEKEAGMLAIGDDLFRATSGANLGRISKRALLDASQRKAMRAMHALDKARFFKEPLTPHKNHRLHQLFRAGYNRGQRLNALGISNAFEGGFDANTNFDELQKVISWNNQHNAGIKALNKLTGDEAQSLAQMLLNKLYY